MKKTILYISACTLIAGFAGVTGCSDSGTTTATDSTTNTSVGTDGSTTTTTTVTHHTYSGKFVPNPDVRYMDLKTHKEVTVRIDTVRGEIVNTETNEPVDFFVAPDTHDTIYGLTGSVVNNSIIHDQSGDYKVDTVKINNPEASKMSAAMEEKHEGNYKEKQRNGNTKIKTDDYKIKEKDGVIKVKER
jgi:hypothetical protein